MKMDFEQTFTEVLSALLDERQTLIIMKRFPDLV